MEPRIPSSIFDQARCGGVERIAPLQRIQEASVSGASGDQAEIYLALGWRSLSVSAFDSVQRP
jgi:hypothetical protein